jgi:hypothetical protein
MYWWCLKNAVQDQREKRQENGETFTITNFITPDVSPNIVRLIKTAGVFGRISVQHRVDD